MKNLLTVDVEEYFQVEGFADVVGRDAWDCYESRVVPAVDRILALLAETGRTATFFVLSWTAERHPENRTAAYRPPIVTVGWLMVQLNLPPNKVRPRPVTNSEITSPCSSVAALHLLDPLVPFLCGAVPRGFDVADSVLHGNCRRPQSDWNRR